MKREDIKQALMEILASPEGKEIMAGIIQIPRLYTVEELEETTGISKHSIRQAIKDGDLEASKIGREYRITALDFARYVKLRQQD